MTKHNDMFYLNTFLDNYDKNVKIAFM
jgi:hypothetical protein